MVQYSCYGCRGTVADFFMLKYDYRYSEGGISKILPAGSFISVFSPMNP